MDKTKVVVRGSNRKRLSNKQIIVLSIINVCALLSVLFALGLRGHLKAEHLRNYNAQVEEFTSVTIPEIKEMSEGNDGFFLFIGLNSCADCQSFMGKLDEALESSRVSRSDVAYLGFTKESKMTVSESAYLTTLINGTKLPFFAWVSGGRVYEFEVTDKTSPRDIEDFLSRSFEK